MKVLGIVASPRAGGNTELLVKETLQAIAAEGIETELITLRDKTIQGCNACMACRKGGDCTIQDDFQPIYEAMVAADGFVIGSPVYFGTATPEAMALLHRAGYVAGAQGRRFERKVGAPIAVARRAGHNFTMAQMLFFFLHQGMIVPGSTYWNVATARELGEVVKDEEGMRTMRNLGKNIAWLLQKINA
jgi:multimeric flavodoxin WrbA